MDLIMYKCNKSNRWDNKKNLFKRVACTFWWSFCYTSGTNLWRTTVLQHVLTTCNASEHQWWNQLDYTGFCCSVLTACKWCSAMFYPSSPHSSLSLCCDKRGTRQEGDDKASVVSDRQIFLIFFLFSHSMKLVSLLYCTYGGVLITTISMFKNVPTWRQNYLAQICQRLIGTKYHTSLKALGAILYKESLKFMTDVFLTAK